MRTGRGSGVLLGILAAVALGTGCAHQAEKTIHEKMAQEPPSAHQDFGLRAEQIIKTAPDLSDDQRSKLLELHDRIHAQAVELQDESFKLRDLLVTDIVQSQYNAKEVNAIKKHLKEVEQQRLNLTFTAVNEANTILGRNAPANYRVLRSIEDIPIHTRD